MQPFRVYVYLIIRYITKKRNVTYNCYETKQQYALYAQQVLSTYYLNVHLSVDYIPHVVVSKQLKNNYVFDSYYSRGFI